MSNKMMKAAFIEEFGSLDKVKVGTQPLPLPSDNEVQIEVAYAGVNPADWKMISGLFKGRMEYQFPLIPGWDVSGRISAVGKKVSQLKIGDAIFAYCRKEKLQEGTYAEYICLNADLVAKKPEKISFAEASIVPLSALTAWQSLFDTAHLRSKQRILIHAGAGGVGSFAIQLAKYAGAYVITTASKANHHYVKSLGADLVIDYTEVDFSNEIARLEPQGLDVVYATVGGTTLHKSYSLVKEGGRLISIVEPIDASLSQSHKIFADYVFVAPNGNQLRQIAELIDEGRVKIPSLEISALEEVVAVLKKSQSGKTRGKMSLKVKEM